MSKKTRTVPSDSDWMLATARTCGVKRRILEKFEESELIGLVWFASIPRFFREDPKADDGFLFYYRNLHLGAFWSAYRRHPDESLLIIGKVRAGDLEVGALSMKMALRENPQVTDAELAKLMAEIDGTNVLDLETVKKRRQRLTKATIRTPKITELPPRPAQ